MNVSFNYKQHVNNAAIKSIPNGGLQCRDPRVNSGLVSIQKQRLFLACHLHIIVNGFQIILYGEDSLELMPESFAYHV